MNFYQTEQRLFSGRRQKLFKMVSENDVLVLFNGSEKNRNYDVNHSYRANSNFYYMTGFEESDSALLCFYKDGKMQSRLYVPPKDRNKEQWEGKRLGVKAGQKYFTDLELRSYECLFDDLIEAFTEPRGLGNLYTNAYSWMGSYDKDYQREKIIEHVIERLQYNPRYRKNPFRGVLNISHDIYQMRLIKDQFDLKMMQKAADISVEAHKDFMRALAPGKYEYEVQAVLEKKFKELGANGVAYGSIIASGSNATILHYHANNAKMKKGDLMLIDAGCEYANYASDITRTIPVSGQYTAEQKAIADIVAEAHQESITKLKSLKRYEDIYPISAKVIVEGLKRLKILKGNTQELIKKQLHKRYYPHSLGHWLGMDVHDPCPYVDSNNKSMPLKKGMVMTIEPGIYFLPDDKTVDKKWRGIGVRIEDDILLNSSKKGYKNLTGALPAYPKDIEEFLKQ